MSSTLRLSIIMVFFLATTALGFVAYNMNLPKEVQIVQVTQKAPAPLTPYLVAARPLKAGTLTRDEDFRSEPLDTVPSGAIRDRLGRLLTRLLSGFSKVLAEDLAEQLTRALFGALPEKVRQPDLGQRGRRALENVAAYVGVALK